MKSPRALTSLVAVALLAGCSALQTTPPTAVHQPMSIRPEPRMDLSAVASTFMAMVNLPPEANVLFMTVMATKMPYVGRG